MTAADTAPILIALFALTVLLTVVLHQFLDLPPFLGMMTGLGLLQVLGWLIHRHEVKRGAKALKLQQLRFPGRRRR